MDADHQFPPKIVPVDSVIQQTSGHFFSEYVEQMFAMVVANSNSDNLAKFSKILNETDLSFNWPQLDRSLNNLLIRKDICYNDNYVESSSYRDEIVDYIRKISPIVDVVYRRYSSILSPSSDNEEISELRKRQFLSKIEQNLFWTGDWRHYLMDSVLLVMNNSKNDGDTRNILALSIMTSGLEQAIGNLINTKSLFIPPLLKDLLQMDQLESLIDIRLIRLLKAMVGPPITLNLRNILWHGFVGCSVRSETNPIIDQRFYYFLLCIATSIGVELRTSFPREFPYIFNEDDDFDDLTAIDLKILQNIPKRELLTFKYYVDRIMESDDLAIVENYLNEVYLHISAEEFPIIVQHCPLISSSQRPIWNYAIGLFEDQTLSLPMRDYCFCLLFPLFESALRYLYCSLNQLPDRMMTAISQEYYITFSELLNHQIEVLPNDDSPFRQMKPNQLFRFLPRALMGQLWDIVQLSDGLRFRDRISHGQLRFGKINSLVSRWTINTMFVVLKFVNTTFEGERNQIRFAVISRQFRCLFHPIYQFQTELKLFFTFLQDFIRKYNQPTSSNNNGNSGHNDDRQPEHFLRNVPFDILNNRLSQYRIYLSEINFDLTKSFVSESGPLMELLRAIVKYIYYTIISIDSFIEMRMEPWRQFQLRSRQRSNLQRLRELCPVFLSSLIMEIFDRLLFIYSKLETFTDLWHNHWSDISEHRSDHGQRKYVLQQKFHRQMKLLLKYSENMRHKGWIHENQWKTVGKLVDDTKVALANIVQLWFQLEQVS